MYALFCVNFYETHNYSTTLHEDLLYWILSETAKKNIEIEVKVNLRKKVKQPDSAPIDMKLTLAHQRFVKNF